MLEHTRAVPIYPPRVVVLGAAGFVGRATADRLAAEGAEVLRLSRADFDLAAPDAAATLAATLRPSDALVFVAARAPCKTPAMLVENIAMAGQVCAALAARPVDHVVYVSSDAVYADSDGPLTEASSCAPEGLHGIMHLAREAMLRETVRDRPLAILRPTLIYGAADPHNGYGPNRFLRLARAGSEIVLFGEGEERRDHVLVDDVADLAGRVLGHRSAGVLNVATGSVHSFRAIAERAAVLAGNVSAVRGTPRQGPMPHRGYRAFDSRAALTAFPDFRFVPLEAGLARTYAAL